MATPTTIRAPTPVEREVLDRFYREGGLNAMDSRLAIAWPLPISERSARDTDHPLLTEEFIGIVP